MSDDVLPVVKGLYLGDELLGDPARNKLHLIGLLNTIRPPAGETYPFTVGKLCAFALLTGGIRPVRARLRIMPPGDAHVYYESREITLEFPTRFTTVYAAFRLSEVTFPVPGGYLVELYCNDRFVEDRLLRLLPTEGTDE